MRVTKQDLELKAQRLNQLLRTIQIRPAYRYNYVALDIYSDGKCIDTLEAGLTKSSAYRLLSAIEKLIILERS